MGFIRRNIRLEEYLDSIGVEWDCLLDANYKHIHEELNTFIESENYNLLKGDDAFSELTTHLPFNGYIFSAPRTKHMYSIYSKGGGNAAFGYVVSGLNILDREILNNIECVLSDKDLTYACVLNHEWEAHCPELFFEKCV